MRDNGPVTQREFLVPAGENLVSTTDLKGRILYCNEAFVAASGFAREELMGQPHNLIRHPDMPEEAFRDLWATVAAGEPWSMLVKNRRKDGDHYWVKANVTPLVDEGRVTGYMSVRCSPDRAEVERADKLYASLRRDEIEGRPLRFRLSRGELLRTGMAGRWQRAGRWMRDHRLALLSLAAAWTGCALGASAGLGWGLAAATPLALAAHALQRRAQQAPLRALLKTAQGLAACDLTQQVRVDQPGSVGQLQQALNQLNVNLQTVVGDARGEVEQVEHAISEISAGNVDLSGRTEAQASGLQQTAASLEQITGTVRSNADSAGESARLVEQTAGLAEKSQATVEGALQTMRSLGDTSERIAQITQVIDAISFQTNLLALNAAVEAARAGEHGRGFAVVAGEVRGLAARTTDAAREIKSLIQRSQDGIGAGVAEVERATQAMQETAASVERVRVLVGGIHTASDEQMKAIVQINEAVSSLDGITQQNAAMVEELAASAVSLRSRALAMKGSVQVFRTGRAEKEAAADAVALRRQARARMQPRTARA